MPDLVRIGVVGTSRYSENTHVVPLKSHPSVKLAAICGRNQDRAREVADKYGIPNVFADYEKMIEKQDLQALVIVSPDDMHYPMTMAALDAGLHVVCEKPSAMNAAQAKEMLQKAESTGVKHMVFLSYRWLPMYRFVKELVDDGLSATWHVFAPT